MGKVESSRGTAAERWWRRCKTEADLGEGRGQWGRGADQNGKNWRCSYGAGFHIHWCSSPKLLPSLNPGQRSPAGPLQEDEQLLSKSSTCPTWSHFTGEACWRTSAGTTVAAREPQRANEPTRSCSSACCFGAARSQPDFDTSWHGPRKTSLQS